MAIWIFVLVQNVLQSSLRARRHEGVRRNALLRVEKPIDFWLQNNRAPAAKKREGGRGDQADRDKEKSPHFEKSAQA